MIMSDAVVEEANAILADVWRCYYHFEFKDGAHEHVYHNDEMPCLICDQWSWIVGEDGDDATGRVRNGMLKLMLLMKKNPADWAKVEANYAGKNDVKPGPAVLLDFGNGVGGMIYDANPK